MSSSSSTLPTQAAQAASTALESAIHSKSQDPSNSAAGPDAKDSVTAEDTQDGQQPITVFQDPNNFNVKHPLYNRWTLWFDNPTQKGASKGSKESWGDDLNEVISFDSVEEFWG